MMQIGYIIGLLCVLEDEPTRSFGDSQMLTINGRPRSVCSGLTRRELLQVGGAGLFGFTLPRVLAAEQAGLPFEKARAKSVLFLYLFGGPSQLETFDMKPDAPSELGGPFKPIASRTSGLHICEHLSRSSQVSDKFAVIRTMTHPHNDHNACHYIQTGHKWTRSAADGNDDVREERPRVVEVVLRRTCGVVRM